MLLSCCRCSTARVVSSMIGTVNSITASSPRRRPQYHFSLFRIRAFATTMMSSFHHPPNHSLVTGSSCRLFASTSAGGGRGGDLKNGDGVTKKSLVDVSTTNIDPDDVDDDDDEGWVPPDDSPLVVNTLTKKQKQLSSLSLASSVGSVGWKSVEGEGGMEEDSKLFPTQQPPLKTIIISSLMTADQQEQNDNNNDDEEEEDFIPPSENSIIEVIDIEATLANEYNRQLLFNNTKHDSGVSSSSSSSSKVIMGEEEFQVQLSDIDSWGDILQELHDIKQFDIVHRLVKEYNLQNLYESIVAAAQDSSASTAASSTTTTTTNTVGGIHTLKNMKDNEVDDNSNVNDDDELVYHYEFIMSLQELTKDEIINELIEYSPSLTQLEMEIISAEMKKRSLLRTKAEEDDNDEQDDDDNLDLNTIPEYNDLRAMVLDDYYQELKKMKQQQHEHCQMTTTGWKEFDTRVALQTTDFATSDIIDTSNNNSDNEEVVEPTSSVVADDTLDNTIDWLHARRSRLGDTNNINSNSNSSPDKDNNNNNTTPTQLLTPGQAELFQHQNSHIPIHMYTLFTTSELSMSLLAQGGSDIHIINTSSNHMQHDNSTGGGGGVGIGCDYILLCTGRNPSHIRVLADSIVRNLKLRKLHERNVLGAIHGIEGGQDIFSNKLSRNRARKVGGGGSGLSGKMDDDWIVIDCDNVHVHILDVVTRKCLNIESLWDLSNPNSEGSKLRRINLSDDDEMDEYVTQNPIPDEYAVKLFNHSNGSDRGRDGWFTGGAGSRVQTVLSSYKRKSFSDKWNGKGSSSSVGGGKKGRRSQRAKSVR